MAKRKVSLIVLLFVHIFNNTSAGQCDCGWRNSKVSLIYNGQETGVNEFPAMVAFVSISRDYRLYGAANILSDKYLLTAAHVIYHEEPSDFLVLVGEHNISSGNDTPDSAIYKVRSFHINPNYDPSIYNNDIAIVETASFIEFSNSVGPICLPFRYNLDDFTGYPAIILGWGSTELNSKTSDVLLGGSTHVISNNDCQSLYLDTITQQMICNSAEISDSCPLDSGGPVLITDATINKMFLVGIISHGRGCGGAPGINTRVTEFLEWINSETSDNHLCHM